MKIDQLVSIFILFLGSTIGGNMRFFILNNFQIIKIHHKFKVLIVNSIASFIFGLFFPLFINHKYNHKEELIIIFLIGFLGSFSTFSTFIYDLFELSLKRKFKDIFILIFSSIFLCLLSIYSAYFLASF